MEETQFFVKFDKCKKFLSKILHGIISCAITKSSQDSISNDANTVIILDNDAWRDIIQKTQHITQ